MLRTNLRDAAAGAAAGSSSKLVAVLGIAALATAVGLTIPAEAKKRQGSTKPAEEAIPDPTNGEPMTLVVSLNNQKVDIYRGTTLITSSKVSTGMRGYATKAGVFSILEKRRHHHSNLYSGAPMPWMQRLTWSGTALHAGVVPGYPASHGCIRLPFSFAPKLFGITTVGEHVVVARESVAPQIIDHPNLFQPLPPPEAPAMVKQDHPPQRQSSLPPQPSAPEGASLPVVLAKVGAGRVTIDRSPGRASTADGGSPVALARMAAAASSQVKGAEIVPAEGTDTADMDTQVEDTHVHAIDPFAGQPASGRGLRAGGSETARAGHALDEKLDGSAAPNTSAESQIAEKSEPEPKAPNASPAATVKAEVASPPPPAPIVAEAALDSNPAAVAKTEAPLTVEPQGAESKPAEDAKTLAEVAPSTVAPEAGQAAPPPAPMPAPQSADSGADINLSVAAMKLGAGAKAAGIQAAEPRSTAPLRVLVTRRTQRDRIIELQRVLAGMGYLEAQDFDGTVGKASIAAFKTFQRNNGLPETGAVSEELIRKVYEVAGKGQPPAGHLYVRQEFGKVFDAPVNFRDPETPLGTHLFTTMKFAPGDTTTRWMAISLQGDDSAAVLDRIEFSDDVRKKISERLTPGSSLIVGDVAINSGSLPKGADFLVWAKETPAKITAASIDGEVSQPRPRKKKKRSVRRPNNNYGYGFAPPLMRGYRNWPW